MKFTTMLNLLYQHKEEHLKAKLPEWGGYWYIEDNWYLCNSDDKHEVEAARIAEFATRNDWIVF